MVTLTKEEAIKVLEEAVKKLAGVTTKEDTLAILLETGKVVGYKPAFRALVAGVEPSKSIRWE